MSPSTAERWASHVAIGDGCWVWLGARDKKGYGRFKDPARKSAACAHRISYEHFVGPIPAGLFVCHRCDNPACVRPDHLFVGTHRDNMDDMAAKGRSTFTRWPELICRPWLDCPERLCRGADHPSAKLTLERVRSIRQRIAAGETQTGLAREFGVTQANISSIVRRKTWAHLED